MLTGTARRIMESESISVAYAQSEARIILEHGFTQWWDSHKLRRILCWAQDDRCAICGGEMSRFNVTLEHVWPRVEGGFNGPGNMVGAHRGCNHAKGSRLPTGCEIISLVAVCMRLDVSVRLKA